MKQLALCLLLASFAHADTLTADVLSGQVHANDTGWSGYFQGTDGHTVQTGGVFSTCSAGSPCALNAIHQNPVLDGSYGGIAVDGRYSYASSSGGLMFVPVTFFDVISGDSLTITGETTVEKFGAVLYGEYALFFDGPEHAAFSISDKLIWNYTAHYYASDSQHPGYFLKDVTITAAPVPELDTMALMLVGLSGLGLFRRLFTLKRF